MRCVGDVEKEVLRKRDRKRDIDCWRTRDAVSGKVVFVDIRNRSENY